MAEIVGKRCKREIIKKDEIDKIAKKQCKLTLNGIHKSYTLYDCYTIKQNEVPWINLLLSVCKTRIE